MSTKDLMKAAGFTEAVNSEVSTSWTVDVDPIGTGRWEIIDGELTLVGELHLARHQIVNEQDQKEVGRKDHVDPEMIPVGDDEWERLQLPDRVTAHQAPNKP